MQDLPAPTTIVYPGSPEQFGNVVHTALRKLYRQDTERLAQEFNLDVEQVAKMRQRNLDRLAKEAGLSSETIARLKAAHRASISTGLDFYPTTQSLVEDYSFVLDENQVGRKAIIDALLAAGEYDLDKDEKRFNLEIWPLLKFVN
jgi:RecB family exonuclease